MLFIIANSNNSLNSQPSLMLKNFSFIPLDSPSLFKVFKSPTINLFLYGFIESRTEL